MFLCGRSFILRLCRVAAAAGLLGSGVGLLCAGRFAAAFASVPVVCSFALASLFWAGFLAGFWAGFLLSGFLAALLLSVAAWEVLVWLVAEVCFLSAPQPTRAVTEKTRTSARAAALLRLLFFMVSQFLSKYDPGLGPVLRNRKGLYCPMSELPFGPRGLSGGLSLPTTHILAGNSYNLWTKVLNKSKTCGQTAFSSRRTDGQGSSSAPIL